MLEGLISNSITLSFVCLVSWMILMFGEKWLLVSSSAQNQEMVSDVGWSPFVLNSFPGIASWCQSHSMWFHLHFFPFFLLHSIPQILIVSDRFLPCIIAHLSCMTGKSIFLAVITTTFILSPDRYWFGWKEICDSRDEGDDKSVRH